MSKIALLFVVALAFATASPLREVAKIRNAEPEWSGFIDFVHAHSRNYETVGEVNYRFDMYKATLVRSAELMRLNPRATFGVNKFADMSPEEFSAKYLMPVNITANYRKNHPNMKKWNAPAVKAPLASVDWSQSACTPVKDQGQCGSCWAFSATQTIESANIIAGKGTPSSPILGPEQIVDCDTTDSGCNGGDPRSGMTYVQSAGGQEPESAYPYTAGQSGQAGQCSFDNTQVAENDAGGPVDVSDGDENALQQFLLATGPPSVAVDASSWQSYTGGVLTSCTCNIDHAVQAVGINADGMANSYKVRNSWNTNWGVNGFIYLEMGQNMCCIANEVSWASV